MLTDQQIKDNLIRRPKECFGQCNRKDEVCYESDDVMCNAFDDCAILAKLKTRDYDPETSPIEHATFQWKGLSKTDKTKIELEIDAVKNEKKETKKSSKARASTEESKKEEKNEDDALIDSLNMDDDDDLDLNSEVDSLVNKAEEKDQDDISLAKELEDEDLDLGDDEENKKEESNESTTEDDLDLGDDEENKEEVKKEKPSKKEEVKKEKPAKEEEVKKEKDLVVMETSFGEIRTLSIPEIKQLIDYAIGKLANALQGNYPLAEKEKGGNAIKLETQEFAPKKKKQADAPLSTKKKAGGRGRPAGAKNKKKAE